MISLILAAALVAPSDAAYEAILKKDGRVHAAQYLDAIEVNIRPELRERLAPIVAAIRYAENGRAGREYGCLSKYAKDKTYRKQAGECAYTVQRQWDRWQKAGARGDFIVSLGNRYCPVGADNDNGTNKYWIKNVQAISARFTKEAK